MFQASSAPIPWNFLAQSTLPRSCSIDAQLALAQFCLGTCFAGSLFTMHTLALTMQWSLLPSLPTSSTSNILSGTFVKITSRMLPLMWVGNSTNCSIMASVAASKTTPPLPLASPSDQRTSRRFKSPIIILLFPACLTRSLSLS